MHKNSWVKAMSRHICFWNCKRSLVANCRRPAGCFRFRFRLGWWVQFAVPLLTAHWHMLSQVPSLIPHPTSLGCQLEPSCHRHWPRPDPHSRLIPLSMTGQSPAIRRPGSTHVPSAHDSDRGYLDVLSHPVWQFRGPSDKLEHDALRFHPLPTHVHWEKKSWLRKFACLRQFKLN